MKGASLKEKNVNNNKNNKKTVQEKGKEGKI